MAELNNVKEVPVLIVGAGPTGLTLACELARRGVGALLVEGEERLFPGSRGKGLQPRTLEVLDDLGLAAAVRRAGGPYPSMLARDGERKGESHEFVKTGPARPGAPYGRGWMLPQWRTQELLYERLRELGGDVSFGTRFTGLTQDGNGDASGAGNGAGDGNGAGGGKGGVTAQLDARGRPLTVRAAWVVAADGGRSAVREAVGVGMPGEAVDQRPRIVADVRLAEGALGREHWHVWREAKGGGLMMCPLAGSELFQLQAEFTDESTRVETTPEAVRELLCARTGLSPADVHEVTWASPFRTRAALADRFRQGRVLLAGDAAHVHSPAGGQGLNTSVQDAYNLGWKLGQVLLNGADSALLETYEEERRPLAADVLGLSTRIHHGQARRGAVTQQLDIGYRGSSLAPTASVPPTGELRAGDRAPDAECRTGDGTELRVHDALRGPHFTLLAMGGAQLPEQVPVEVRAFTLTSAQPHAREAYGSGVFLIRPDGYVTAAYGPGGELDEGLTKRLGLR